MADLREEERPHVDTSPDSLMYDPRDIIDSCEVYTVGERQKTNPDTIPFIQTVNLNGFKGILLKVKATFDDGAMVNIIDTTFFWNICDKVSPPKIS